MDFVLSFGKIDGVDTPASTITIDNIRVEKIADASISEQVVALAEAMPEAETEETTGAIVTAPLSVIRY